MVKQEVLNDYKKQEDKVCLANILDKIELMKSKDKMQTTDFLDIYQVSLVECFLKKIKFHNYILFGGFENAERKILIMYPEKYNIQMIEKNYNKILKIVRVNVQNEDESYSHRTYLGGIVKLGLKREKVGDIIVCEDGADIVVVDDFAKILENELRSLTRFQNSTIKVVEIGEIRKQEIKVEDVKIIVPSMRMDNIISDLAKTSRSKAVQIINQERVFINGQCETKVSKQLKLNDIITIRGKGRFIIKEFTATTRSGRNVVRIEKYV